MEQIILIAIMQYVQDNQVFKPSQHRFKKRRSCLTKMISFFDKVTCLVDKGKAVAVVSLDFSKTFDTVSHSILLEKLTFHGVDGCTLDWGKNKKAGWPSPECGVEWNYIQLATGEVPQG